jgi:hypothetical protein
MSFDSVIFAYGQNKMHECTMMLPRGIREESIVGYARLYQLETWLRELVYLETKAHFGPQWWAQADAAIARSKTPGMPAEKSLSRDKKHPHMATPENDPLWFLSFEALLKIIFDDQLWPLFECYLTTKELLQAKFSEILPIRNRIGHNRPLHEDDLDRLRRILRDLDQGFWRFCTSFNDTQPFISKLGEDVVYTHFKERTGFDYVEVGPNQFALVGSTIGMSQNLRVEYGYRPSAASKNFPEKGRTYHFTYSCNVRDRRWMDYRRILEQTQRFHSMIVYIVLDSFQQQLGLSIPAIHPTPEIINAAESFYEACGNLFTYSFSEKLEKDAEGKGLSPLQQIDEINRPFEVLAAMWPHYVVPAGHAFEVLGPDCPCSFFDV